MIVTFGSINVDLIFRVKEMPQIGQTILAVGSQVEAGGKGANQALAAARDGAKVLMVGSVGRDAMAPIALQSLEGAVDLTHVDRVSLPTGSASVIIGADGCNMIAVAAGANLAACSSAVTDDLLQSASYVLLQMENDVAQIESIIRRVAKQSAKSILNLAPAYELGRNILSLVDIIVVNEDESEALADWLGCEATAQSLSGELGTVVLRTMGKDGAEVYLSDELIRIPATPIEVVDTTGAGDCFIGVLAAALDRGLSLRAAMKRAATSAAIACSRLGSQSSIPYASETDRWMSEIRP